MFIAIYGPAEGERFFDKVPLERPEHMLSVYRKNMDSLPLQVRSFDGIDLEALQVQRHNIGTEGYELDP